MLASSLIVVGVPKKGKMTQWFSKFRNGVYIEQILMKKFE
jgi:hypothetical protein